MVTTKRFAFLAAFFLVFLAFVSSAFAVGTSPFGGGLNLFYIGGPTATQIIPIFPTWTMNVPLSPPTSPAAASSTQGGSLGSGSPLYFKIAASNGTGTTTGSTEIATTTNAANLQTNLTWSAIPGATKYFVYFSTTTAGAENAYFLATTTTAYNFTSTSSPTAYGPPPGFPSSFALQMGNGAQPLVVNGVNESMLATTTSTLGGTALTVGSCLTATSTLAIGTISSSTVIDTTPQKFPGYGVTWQSYALNSTQIVTELCALLSVTPVATLYNIRAF